MNRTYRSRAPFANQPSKRKKRDYDATNDLAARVILADTRKRTAFQVRWARAFTRRLAAESAATLSATEGTTRGRGGSNL